MTYIYLDAIHWREKYESGMTFEQIELETGVSQGTIRRWVGKVGNRSRPKGGRPGFEKKGKSTEGIKGKKAPSIKHGAGVYGRQRRRKGYFA